MSRSEIEDGMGFAGFAAERTNQASVLGSWDREWQHFRRVDIAPEAPDVQVAEMRKAFYAGMASGAKLGDRFGLESNLAAMKEHIAREDARRRSAATGEGEHGR